MNPDVHLFRSLLLFFPDRFYPSMLTARWSENEQFREKIVKNQSLVKIVGQEWGYLSIICKNN